MKIRKKWQNILATFKIKKKTKNVICGKPLPNLMNTDEDTAMSD